MLSGLLPQTSTKILENKWVNLNKGWEEKYWNLTDKFDTLSENDFIKDREILDKFEALRYIGEFKDCTLIQASNKIEKIIWLINNNIDYIIFNDRITWFTYVLVKDICSFFILELEKIEKEENISQESLKLILNIVIELNKLYDLFVKQFLLIDPFLVYLALKKDDTYLKKLIYRINYLTKQIDVLLEIKNKIEFIILENKKLLLL